MCKPAHILFLTAWLLLSGTAVRAQDRLLGVFQSPKGAGVTAVLGSREGGETNIFTLRTDFYGILSGRTRKPGVFFTYTHDYDLLRTDVEDCTLILHAGAGGMLGYAHDFEKGFFSTFDRQLKHPRGGVAAVAGTAGLRIDFPRRLTLDISFTAAPGIHLRSDRSTGALLLSFYKAGIYHVYYPQINLLYRFR